MAIEIVSLPRLSNQDNLLYWARELVDTLQRVFTGQTSGIAIDIHALKSGATTWALEQVTRPEQVPLPDATWTTVITKQIDLTDLTLGEQSGVVVQAYSDITTYVNTPTGPRITTGLFIDNVEVGRQEQIFQQISEYTVAQGTMQFLGPGLHVLDFRIFADWAGNTGGAILAQRSRVMFTALR